MPRTNLSDQFNPDQRKQWAPKIIARNTFRFTREGEIVIRLHATDIARKLPDGSVILHSGGWRTVTTKDRMNSAMPAGYSLLQEHGQWYVLKHPADGDGRRWWQGDKIPFFDGIQVPQCFSKKSLQAKGAKEEKRQAKLREQIKRFVGKLDKLKKLPAPESGDCWYCHMHIAEGKDKGKSWGDSSGNTEHLLSHVQEGYLHGSLLLNALKHADYREPGFIWQLCNRELAEGKSPTWAKRALRKYLYRQLGLIS